VLERVRPRQREAAARRLQEWRLCQQPARRQPRPEARLEQQLLLLLLLMVVAQLQLAQLLRRRRRGQGRGGAVARRYVKAALVI
jgi:hypothetical protein